jgi:2-polyprenyl-6-methoxyphenol hydroxylase-like FAD-dependent oxidoreductase
MPRRAIVIGGSMSGLFAGLMLRSAGWRVDVFEKVEGELSGRGAGIVAQPEILAILRGLGLTASELGVPVRMRRMFDASGRITIETECPQVMTAWERVYRILRDAFPAANYHRGRSLRALQQDGDGVTAIFADGAREQGDVLLGADGIRSTVRALCAPGCGQRSAAGASALQSRLVSTGRGAYRTGLALDRRKRGYAFDVDPAAADLESLDRGNAAGGETAAGAAIRRSGRSRRTADAAADL